MSQAGRAQWARAFGAPRVALVPVAHRRPGRAAMPGRGACLNLACVALLVFGVAGTYPVLWRALP